MRIREPSRPGAPGTDFAYDRRKMSISAYATVTTLLTLLGLAGLLSLRFVGLYSHQALWSSRATTWTMPRAPAS